MAILTKLMMKLKCNWKRCIKRIFKHLKDCKDKRFQEMRWNCMLLRAQIDDNSRWTWRTRRAITIQTWIEQCFKSFGRILMLNLSRRESIELPNRFLEPQVLNLQNQLRQWAVTGLRWVVSSLRVRALWEEVPPLQEGRAALFSHLWTRESRLSRAYRALRSFWERRLINNLSNLDKNLTQFMTNISKSKSSMIT